MWATMVSPGSYDVGCDGPLWLDGGYDEWWGGDASGDALPDGAVMVAGMVLPSLGYGAE